MTTTTQPTLTVKEHRRLLTATLTRHGADMRDFADTQLSF